MEHIIVFGVVLFAAIALMGGVSYNYEKKNGFQSPEHSSDSVSVDSLSIPDYVEYVNEYQRTEHSDLKKAVLMEREQILRMEPGETKMLMIGMWNSKLHRYLVEISDGTDLNPEELFIDIPALDSPLQHVA